MALPFAAVYVSLLHLSVLEHGLDVVTLAGRHRFPTPRPQLALFAIPLLGTQSCDTEPKEKTLLGIQKVNSQNGSMLVKLPRQGVRLEGISLQKSEVYSP